jgi:hypothetical protein
MASVEAQLLQDIVAGLHRIAEALEGQTEALDDLREAVDGVKVEILRWAESDVNNR